MQVRLDYVAVAVKDVEQAQKTFEQNLGIQCERVEEVPSEGAKVAFFDLGGPHLELVAASDPSAAISRSIDKRGEGLHHICLEVEDIEVALRLLRALNVPVVGEAPRPGAGGTKVAFLHPKAMHGVLIELVEHPRSSS